MRLDIRVRDLDESEELVEYVKRRVHAHLGRFGTNVGSVSVRLGDANGPKGGVDKQCRIVARGPRVGTISLDALRAEPHAAVVSCVERMAEALGRALEKARDAGSRAPAELEE